MKKPLGGNVLARLNASGGALSRQPYFYHFQAGKPGSELPDLRGRRWVLVNAGTQFTRVEIGETWIGLEPGHVLFGQGHSQPAIVREGRSDLFFAAVPAAAGVAPRLECRQEAALKRVDKPWGHELWITGEDPDFAFKKIVLRAGFRTSLQFHQHKQETNALYRGRAALHYQSDLSVRLGEVSSQHVGRQVLQAPVAIHVLPLTLHRIEAITDLVLYEVSTPHLDDVVRISDDTARPDGRIAAEHGKKAA